MASPAYSILLLAYSIVICKSSPLPANITSTDLGLKEGSCALGDVVYMPGDEFPGASPCEKCSCANGDVQCAKQRCEPRPGCKAVHRPDHCCPTYQCECEQEGRIYGNGEKLVDPADPCRVCYCQGGEVVCRRIACFVRDDCRPRLVPGRCCPEYDNCPVRGNTTQLLARKSHYGNGEKLVDPADPCRVCYCQGGEVVCRRIACFVRDDCRPRLVPGRCCPEYDNCPVRGNTTQLLARKSHYGNGEKLVDPADPCRVCYCQGGEVVCRRIACFVRDDCRPRLVPGRCCPEYDNCPVRGNTTQLLARKSHYGNGEKLVDPADPCRVCYCQGGEVVCRRIACFVRDDCRPRLVPGRCCPEYDNCPVRGNTTQLLARKSHYGNGEKLVDPADPCRVCYCQGGEVVCRRIACFVRDDCRPRLVPGRCCPEYDNCPVRGNTTQLLARKSHYGNGEKLVDPADPCRVCYCQGGEVVCRRIACFVRDDCRPRLVPGRCCPEYDNCPVRGNTTQLLARKSHYGNGEKLVDPADPCRVCYCQGGEVVCRRIACFVRDDCRPRLVPGRCCPEYDNCPVRGNTTQLLARKSHYGNGEKLVDPADPCRVCYCQGGEVVCRRIACFVRDDCRPRLVPGRCCPEYDNCPVRGNTTQLLARKSHYGNGEKLVDPADPCRVCYCQGGEVVCRRIACFVRDDCRPRLVPGRCCPEYDNCPVRGNTTQLLARKSHYGNGEKLVDPADPCRVCYCQGGEVVCRRIACFVRDDCRPRLVPGRCCPEYDNCPVRGNTTQLLARKSHYGNGEKLVDPADPCRVCYCQGGEVVCRRIACFVRDDCRPRLVPGRCCPEYDNCPVRGNTTQLLARKSHYGNGEKLVDPADPCRVCYCQGGEVVCRRIACFVRDDCRPRLVPGRCCPEYDNCPVRGNTTQLLARKSHYGNGEKLVDPADPCRVCYCQGGEVVCRRIACFVRDDCRPRLVPGRCCPEYDNCPVRGNTTQLLARKSHYGNGEKLVDPADPCRVCYCQGGEVVCRRIACFVRDDCRPRLVPGRCCPEYDNCPVRGVTSLPGMTPLMPNPSVADVEASAPPAQPAEPVMPESKITIKEITPVSEIPVITNVKIKEILPSSSMEVAEYSSSKSPLIPREATSEKSPSSVESNENVEKSDTKDASSLSPELSTTSNEKSAEIKSNDDLSPSKISLSTQPDSENIFEPKIPSIIPMMGGPSAIVHPEPVTTKAPILEEEDMDHNPAFPPIPDDLFLVLGNHEEEIISDQNVENEHVPIDHEVISVSSVPISTEEPIFKETSGSTVGYIPEAVLSTKNNLQEISSESSTFKEAVSTVQPSTSRENTMLNMRSVIPTDILNSPSLISDDVTDDMLKVTESSVTEETVSDDLSPTDMSDTDIAPKYLNNESQLNIEDNISESNFNVSTTSAAPIQKTSENSQSIDEPDQLISTFSKSTEIISRTEFSSIPIETSDQNPRETSDKDNKDKITVSTPDSSEESTSTLPFDGEDNTESKSILSETNNQSFDNGETTEFILTSFDSQESTTDDIELIKVSSDTDKSSAIVEPPRARNNNVLTDLINLVGDVASISDHTTGPNIEHQNSSPTTISDSEELIPVNVAAGYKSKNKNWNLNSITEVPVKNKAVPMMKQKVVEIEDDSDTITDSPPPYDKVEPTTKTPIIDNVSDDTSENKTVATDRKDFEIITKSYVPTINRRPTKVVMKKSNEKPIFEDSTNEDIATSTEVAPENNISSSEAPSVSEVSATDSGAEEQVTEDTTELRDTTQ